MPSEADGDRFESTAEYYARYRPGYGDEAIDLLVEQFDLDRCSRVLDLGCGTGRIAVPLAAHVDEVVGMDPSAAMLREARERARWAGRTNVRWVRGSDSDLDDEFGPLQLTTMGRSFHWMDREATLDRLYDLTDPGGGVAFLGDPEWLTRGTEDWQAAVYDLADEYLEDLPERTGPVEYEETYDELLDDFGFVDTAVATFERERTWTPDEVVGYVFSLSFCSPERFGDDREAFEADLRDLLARQDRETFGQTAEVEVITGLKPPGRERDDQ